MELILLASNANKATFKEIKHVVLSVNFIYKEIIVLQLVKVITLQSMEFAFVYN